MRFSIDELGFVVEDSESTEDQESTLKRWLAVGNRGYVVDPNFALSCEITRVTKTQMTVRYVRNGEEISVRFPMPRTVGETRSEIGGSRRKLWASRDAVYRLIAKRRRGRKLSKLTQVTSEIEAMTKPLGWGGKVDRAWAKVSPEDLETVMEKAQDLLDTVKKIRGESDT